MTVLPPDGSNVGLTLTAVAVESAIFENAPSQPPPHFLGKQRMGGRADTNKDGQTAYQRLTNEICALHNWRLLSNKQHLKEKCDKHSECCQMKLPAIFCSGVNVITVIIGSYSVERK